VSLFRQWIAAPGRPTEAPSVQDAAEPGLLAQARRGDRTAFDRLVGAHHDQLRGFLARRVSPEAADDVVQETLVAAWIAIARFDGRSRFKTWLYGIALHKCADYARRERRAAAQIIGHEEADSGARSVEELFAQAELRETIQGLLARLPGTQREVIEMYYYAELTLPEIARALGRNLNTVKYQFYRAHTQVAHGLDDAAIAPAARLSPAPRQNLGEFAKP